MMYRIFGDSPTVRIVEWMLENRDFDHSISEIAEGTKLNKPATTKGIQPLIAHNVIVSNRTISKDKMYVLDLQNRCTKAIIDFDKQIAKCCDWKEPIQILPPEI